MDLDPKFVCCWGCPVALLPVAACILFSLIALGTGRALGTKAGSVARGLGFGLSVTGLLAGLAALYTIVRFGIAWEAGWSTNPEYGIDFFIAAGFRHRAYDLVFAVAWLIAMIVTWVAVPRIVSGVKAAGPRHSPAQGTSANSISIESLPQRSHREQRHGEGQRADTDAV